MTKKIIIYTVLGVLLLALVGLVIFVSLNWNKFKSATEGAQLYLYEDLVEAKKEGYEEAKINEDKYLEQIESYTILIAEYEEEVSNLKNSNEVKDSEIIELNSKIATLQGEIDFVLKFTNNEDTSLIEMTEKLEFLKQEIVEYGNQRYNEGYTVGLEAGRMPEEELNAILEAERQKAYQEGYERKEYEESMRYYVTYNPNIPSEAVTQIEGEMTFSVHYAGEESALKSNNYSLFGFDFAGWNTSKDGTGTTYTNEEIMNLETPQDINLYAQWKLKEYKITYNLNDGYLAETNPTTVYTVSEDFTLNNPTKTGYNFKGWTGTGLSSPTLNVVIKQGTTTDLEFTAVFEVIEYTITYNYGDGSVWKENQTTYTVETPEFKLIEPELEGYDFVGWTGTELSEPTEDIYVGGGMIGNREYTANYELAKFKLYFEIDDEDYYFNGPAMVVVPSSKTVTYSKGYNAEGLFAYTNQIVRGDKDSGTVTHVCIGWQIDDIQVTYDSEFVWEFLEDKVAKPIWMAV